MARNWMRLSGIVAASAALLSCSDATGPRHGNVDVARSRWLGSHPPAYTFEVATESSWCPRSGYYRVEVRSGEVVIARDAAGRVVPGFTLTVEGIWDQLLAARAKGELNSAAFDVRGVPVECDMGSWPVDSGVHYWIREFVRTP